MITRFFKKKNILVSHPMKIVGVHGKPEAKDITVLYQVAGKSAISEEIPENIISELGGLCGFSKHDSDLIYELFLTQLNTTKYRIKKLHFDIQNIFFEIEDIINNQIMHLSAEEALLLDNIDNNFSKQDSLAFSYAAQKNRNKMDFERMKKAKKREELKLHVIKNH